VKIFHLSTFSFEGGAAKAAARLHKMLRNANVDSRFYALRITKFFDALYSPNIFFGFKLFKRLRPYIDSLPLRLLSRKKNTPWTIGLLPSRLVEIGSEKGDLVVHVHWVGAGFVSLNSLRIFKNKLVFTLHDSWLFTAGCHLPYECDKFKTKCSSCPQLGHQANFLVQYLFDIKKSFLSEMNPVIICPSRWMLSQAKESSLLKECDIRYIPNGVDVNIFSPQQNFSKDNYFFVIGFSALHAIVDVNKGFHLFLSALEYIKSTRDISNILIEVIGANESDLVDISLPFPAKFHGIIESDYDLAAIYSTAHIFCVPSITESFCQVAAESISSGTPVVSFATSGLKDIVIDKQTGFLAKPFDYKDLAGKILMAYDDRVQLNLMSQIAREYAVDNFDAKLIATNMHTLYAEITGKSRLQ
jgi:glycosyltransferase involved in cell wall biosynthesis